MSSSRLLPRTLPRTIIRTTTTMPTPIPAMPDKQPDSTSRPNVQQSPNVPSTWSASQNPKPHAYDNARFTQINLSMQPNALAGMGMVEKDPIRLVLGRRATCDGGEYRRDSSCPSHSAGPTNKASTLSRRVSRDNLKRKV